MPTLEEALLSQGLVTGEQIEDARRLDADLRGGLGLNLVRLRYIPEETLVDAIRRAVPGIQQVVDQAAAAKASSFALGLLPVTMIERHRAVPMALQGSTLTVAMADPLDAAAIAEIERHAKCKVVPAVAPESVVSWALLRFFNLLTPAYMPASAGARTAASVSLNADDPDADAAIPLTRRRRAPMGDAPEDLDQIPVDLLVRSRRSQPPPAPPPDMGRIGQALERIERQRRKTARDTPEPPPEAAPPVPPPVPPPTSRVA
ncbi:MAG: hypothetical protein QME96_18740, partial [Myxococcota bacterium]|nr:hypothetical protein [Myxococcota bacterium]